MDTNATRRLIERFNDAWVDNDAARMAPLVSDDVVWVLPLGLRPSGRETLEGREHVVTGLTGGSGSVAEAILKMDTMVRTVHTLVVEGETAVGFHHMSAELVRGGTYSNEYVWRYTCAAGKVTRLVEHVDTLHAYKQNADHPLFSGVLDN